MIEAATVYASVKVPIDRIVDQKLHAIIMK